MSAKIYSSALGTEKTIYTSGQIALDKNGAVFGDDIYTQTIKTLENVRDAIFEKNFSIYNITSLTIYLSDIERDFLQFNEAYKAFFKECKPARATVGATLFKPEFLIEIQAVCNKDVDNRI